MLSREEMYKLSRRGLLKGALGAGAGAFLAGPTFWPELLRAAPKPRPAKAKSIIQIWMWGGPSHLDTFDPKPEAGEDYTGPLNKPIETNVKGIRIGPTVPDFLTPPVVQVLVDNFQLTPVGDAQEDLAAMLG